MTSPRLCASAVHSTEETPALPADLPSQLTEAGILPIRKGPVRFAVGAPNGMTSNSWRLWADCKGNVYIACRDNLKEAKVSLHASGRWRMAFTTEALIKNPNLVRLEEDRAWEVWEKPLPQLPSTTIAFRLFFPTSELAVRPEQRGREEWRAPLVFVEPAPQGSGKLTALTLFVTNGDVQLNHETEPSFRLASLSIGNKMYAQLMAHAEPEGNVPKIIERTAEHAQLKVRASGLELPADAYLYVLGRMDDGSRFLVGARAHR